MREIAALFVATGGCYFGLPGVTPWDISRDARFYDGPHPVVAHPPCERWGAYYAGAPWQKKLGVRKVKGDDDGCFASALAAVTRYGGVLEHPAGSHAWRHHGIARPGDGRRWWPALGGWTCEIYQGAYGHAGLKKTWLYLYGRDDPPDLRWGRPAGEFLGRMRPGVAYNIEGRRREGAVAYMSRKERAATPLPFRDLLIDLARGCNGQAIE